MPHPITIINAQRAQKLQPAADFPELLMNGAVDRANALDHRRPGRINVKVFVRDHLEPPVRNLQEFARPQQKVWI